MIKTIYVATALIAVSMSIPALAQTKAEEHQAHHPQASASVPTAKPATATPTANAASDGMHEHMDKHCADMKKIMSIKDAKKRQKAMADHKKMHEEGGCPMMKDGMDSGMRMGKSMGAGASAPMEMNKDMKGGMDK